MSRPSRSHCVVSHSRPHAPHQTTDGRRSASSCDTTAVRRPRSPQPGHQFIDAGTGMSARGIGSSTAMARRASDRTAPAMSPAHGRYTAQATCPASHPHMAGSVRTGHTFGCRSPRTAVTQNSVSWAICERHSDAGSW